MHVPRVLVAGLRGGSGKTLVSLGIAAAWRREGRAVAPFKKGPDYIDAAWLTAAAQRPCRNLDLFLMKPTVVVDAFLAATRDAGIAVIEGNRGLYDGLDAQGSCSTAELAKLLGAPIVLAIDCTKMTRTVAAQVLGCLRLDPDVPIRGVVLNQVAGDRHQAVIREAIAQVCGVPVLGAIPRIRERIFPERHLGLVPPQEHASVAESIARAADIVSEYLDLEAIRGIADAAPTIDDRGAQRSAQTPAVARQVRIGVFRDAAFQFYYPDNLEALTTAGASLIEISPLRDTRLPEVDALYIGGGFPETMAAALAGNRPFLDAVRKRIETGLPVYAECGGAVFLGESLVLDGNEYPMAGVLPATFAMRAKPQGHGYAELEAVPGNPFFTAGQRVRGHEFHYTHLLSPDPPELTFAFRVHRGHGFDGEHDGLCTRNVLANYTHVHALGAETWAPAVIRAAEQFKARH